jgi:quercetin dioxygenase-like cupin family protein
MGRVTSEQALTATNPTGGAGELELVPAIDGSALALSVVRLEPGLTLSLADAQRDTLLYALAGTGLLSIRGDSSGFRAGSAALVIAGEEASLAPKASGFAVLRATVGPDVDRHAPLGPRETVVQLEDADARGATGARSYLILFGPSNGSTRATLFAGFIPPGKAPWHYHLYDEIVWVPDGPGRLHLEGGVEELGRGSAFRLRPREAHIVENTSPDREMTVIGVFTPAGSPSAAYLSPDVAAEYRFAG